MTLRNSLQRLFLASILALSAPVALAAEGEVKRGHPNRLVSASPEFALELPASIVVFPPLNHAQDLRASNSVYPSLYTTLASKGFEVPAPSAVVALLRANGVEDWGLIAEIPYEKLGQVFGTDAALFTEILEYGSHYQVFRTKSVVELRARLVSLKSGRLLWQGSGKAEVIDQDNASLARMLVNALLSQIINDATNFAVRVAPVAAYQLLWDSNLPAGPHCPEVGEKGTDCFRLLEAKAL